jgi:predicted DCC family thiol-disulfide oxidoreductase YuxK
MSAVGRAVNFGREAAEAAWQVWKKIWFQDLPTTPIEITRMGVGAAMLLHYGAATPYLFTLWGDEGWLPRQYLVDYATSPWMQSVFFYLSEPWHWIAFHTLFLICTASLMLGWRTWIVKWIVLIGHVSYVYRTPFLYYGVDQILAHLLLIMCFAPIGRALSLDRVRAVRKAKRADLNAIVPRYTSEWAGACTRLMQIQMAVLFFYSAVAKHGGDWVDGDAIWFVFADSENYYYNGLLLDLFANQYWIVNFATYGTLLIEIAYPFLIWQKATRPYALTGALFLHSQFAVLMGLFYFSFVMMMGHMSFLRPEWLYRLGEWWKKKIGDMEMIYDGRCGFCVRSMAWFMAFDGLRQIRIRNFRTDPSPLVSDEKMEKHLYLVLPDGRTLPGFDAYRHAVLRVPGLWWQVPLFYIPVLSKLFGRPIYNWVAAHRGWLSSLRLRRPRPAKASAS